MSWSDDPEKAAENWRKLLSSFTPLQFCVIFISAAFFLSAMLFFAFDAAFHKLLGEIVVVEKQHADLSTSNLKLKSKLDSTFNELTDEKNNALETRKNLTEKVASVEKNLISCTTVSSAISALENSLIASSRARLSLIDSRVCGGTAQEPIACDDVQYQDRKSQYDQVIQIERDRLKPWYELQKNCLVK